MNSTAIATATANPLRRMKLALAVAALALAAALSMGVADSQAAVYSGNQCSTARWYLDNSGAESCAYLNGKTASAITLTAGAYDYARDGYSALNETEVQQYINGVWYTGPRVSFYNSAGFGTTNLAAPFSVARRAGASHFRIRMTACTYDSPTARRISCATTYWGYAW
jgi:hypothetical protein